MNDKILSKVKKFKEVNERICYIELECGWSNVILIDEYTSGEDRKRKSKIYYTKVWIICAI